MGRWPARRWIETVVAVVAILGIFFYFNQPPSEAELVRRDAAAKQRAIDEAYRAAEKKRETDRVEAILVCQRAVKEKAKFPSKTDFDPGFLKIPEAGQLRNDPTAWSVRGSVEMMNSFGAMIPHRYACNVKGGRVTLVEVQPG